MMKVSDPIWPCPDQTSQDKPDRGTETGSRAFENLIRNQAKTLDPDPKSLYSDNCEGRGLLKHGLHLKDDLPMHMKSM